MSMKDCSAASLAMRTSEKWMYVKTESQLTIAASNESEKKLLDELYMEGRWNKRREHDVKKDCARGLCLELICRSPSGSARREGWTMEKEVGHVSMALDREAACKK